MTSTTGDQLSISDPGKPQARKIKTLTSRLGSLFASKPSHINECYIQLDEHGRVYHPGDKVKGSFVLDVARPLGVTHIAVSLFGYLEVFKNHSRNKGDHHDNVARVASGKGKRWVSEYYGDGFASLFEDELVLCGQGRLDPKLYHFRFELDFPGHLNLPSSIWFERGTVRYVVSATITRPTTMNPTTTTSRKVEFKEAIDVGAMPMPKPRIVTLEPVERGSKSRVVRRVGNQLHPNESGSLCPPSPNSSKGDQSSQTTATRNNPSGGSRVPTPTSPSIASSISMRNSFARDSTLPADARSSRASHRVEFGSISTSREPGRTIMAVVQPSRGGCLPGEILSLTVTVNHTKPVRSVHGVIVTLYRQARVDMHPNLPLGPAGNPKGKNQKFEDYYPRSKTGLGGLSLSAAGSGQVWRKDLCQAFAPLYINPHTMSTVVKTAVRVPDDSFPTFRNAPGDMISFRYFVEVIIDIHGKLAGLTGLSEDVTLPNSQTSTSGMNDESSMFDEAQHIPRWSANCIDTAPMRREKNAVVCINDLIVGTKDSGKRRGKARRTHSNDQTSILSASHLAVSQPPHTDVLDQQPHPSPRAFEQHNSNSHQSNGYRLPGRSREDDYYGYEHGYEFDYSADYGYGDEPRYVNGQEDPPHWGSEMHPSAPYEPQMSLLRPPAEEGLTEKEQLRRREEALMPSRPPDVNGDHQGTEQAPSAPYIPDENDFETAEAFRDAIASQAQAGPPQQANAPSVVAREATPSAENDFLSDVPAQPVPTYTPSPTTHGHASTSPHVSTTQRHISNVETAADANITSQDSEAVASHASSGLHSDREHQRELFEAQTELEGPEDRSEES